MSDGINHSHGRDESVNCEICGDPMPEGETMFKFHGYSGPCPKPPLKKPREAAPIMKYFAYSHLSPSLQMVSKDLCDLAIKLEENLPDCAEKSAGLRKLLEAKDCFVRARLS